MSPGSSRVGGFIAVCPVGLPVHPGSLGSLGCALTVVEFIRGRCVHFGALSGSSGSPWVPRFIGVRHGGRRFHAGLLGSFR